MSPPEGGADIIIPNNRNNCVKNYKLKVPFKSFEENYAQTRNFLTHHLIWAEIIVICMGQKQILPQFSLIFHLFKYVVIIFLRVRHSTSHFFTKTHVLNCFRCISTVQPKSLCSSPFKQNWYSKVVKEWPDFGNGNYLLYTNYKTVVKINVFKPYRFKLSTFEINDHVLNLIKCCLQFGIS